MPSSSDQSSRPAHVILAVALLLAGLSLAWGTAWRVHAGDHDEARLRFDRLADSLCDDITRRLDGPAYALRSLRGFFNASERITRAEFAAYIGSHDLATEFPGVAGFGFVERVRRENLDAFVAEVRADGAPDFSVRGNGSGPELYVLRYGYPQKNNRAAEGFDTYSEPVRRAAIDRAKNLDRLTLTAPVTLSHAPVSGIGYLLPIYRAGLPSRLRKSATPRFTA